MMELTSSSSITKMFKRRMRRGLHAKKLALMGSDVGVLWVGDVMMRYKNDLN